MQRLGMRYRGNETWHAQEVAVYEITSGAWAALRAPSATP
jgi:hypothetical protein